VRGQVEEVRSLFQMFMAINKLHMVIIRQFKLELMLMAMMEEGWPQLASGMREADRVAQFASQHRRILPSMWRRTAP